MGTNLKTWDQSYSVGITLLDGDHRKILDMINKLHEAMTSGQSKSVMAQLITDLKQYSITHFSNEEDYLAQINYPGLSDQREKHRIFINKINDFEREFSKGNILLAMEVMPFLNDWLLQHIMETDKKYAKHTQ